MVVPAELSEPSIHQLLTSNRGDASLMSLAQVIDAAEQVGVPLSGENALPRYDDYAFDQIAESVFGRTKRPSRLTKITFLRMGNQMFDNWDSFLGFLHRMQG
jgi:beta-amylase